MTLQMGARLRERRLELSLSARELAERVSVSASLISQIERGTTTPSVASLYAIVSELGISLDSLFALEGPAPPEPPSPTPEQNGVSRAGPVVRADQRESIHLDSGVHWQRLTRFTDPLADFHYLIYEPGAASGDAGTLMHHDGHEYGYVISGLLRVTRGSHEHMLGAGDSISFDSDEPHRLAALGDEPVHAIWAVVGRTRPYGT